MIPANDKNFERFLKRSTKMMILFTAPFAGPCNLLRPLVEEYANNDDGIVVVEFSVDDNPNTPASYGVKGVPTLLTLHENVPVQMVLGSLNDAQLSEVYAKIKEA